jgi:hypothetical protein
VKRWIWPLVLTLILGVALFMVLRAPGEPRETIAEPAPPAEGVEPPVEALEPELRLGMQLTYEQMLFYKALSRNSDRDRGGLAMYAVVDGQLSPLKLTREGYTSWRESRRGGSASRGHDSAAQLANALVEKDLDCAALSAPRVLELASRAGIGGLDLVAVAQLGQPGGQRQSMALALRPGVAAPGEDLSGLRVAAGEQMLARLTLGGLLSAPPEVLSNEALVEGLRGGTLDLVAGSERLLKPLIEAGEATAWREVTDAENALSYNLIVCRSDSLVKPEPSRVLRRALTGYRTYLERAAEADVLVVRYDYARDAMVDVARAMDLADRALAAGLIKEPVAVVDLAEEQSSGEPGTALDRPVPSVLWVDNRFLTSKGKGENKGGKGRGKGHD